MRRDEAVRTLRELAEQTLYSELVVEAAGHSWNVTPASLGMTADVEGAVARALAVADDLSFTSRVYHRLRNIPVDASLDLPFREHRGEREGVRAAGVRRGGAARGRRPVRARRRRARDEPVAHRPGAGDRGGHRSDRRGPRAARPTRSRSRSERSSPRSRRPRSGSRSSWISPRTTCTCTTGSRSWPTTRSRPPPPATPRPSGRGRSWTSARTPPGTTRRRTRWGADLPPVIAPGPGQPAGHPGDLPQRPGDPHPRDVQLVVDRHVRVARLHPDVHLGFGGAVRPRSTWARASSSSRSRRRFLSLFLSGSRRSALARTLPPGYVGRVLRGDQRGDPAATAEYISFRDRPRPPRARPADPRPAPVEPPRRCLKSHPCDLAFRSCGPVRGSAARCPRRRRRWSGTRRARSS